MPLLQDFLLHDAGFKDLNTVYKNCEGHIRLLKGDFLQQYTSCQPNPAAGWLAYLHNALHKHHCTFKSGIFFWSFSFKECIFRINSQHEFWKISYSYKDTNTLNSSALRCAALTANIVTCKISYKHFLTMAIEKIPFGFVACCFFITKMLPP